ncbi:MAG: class I SAM-dependent methyltransferase [Acidobacteria bacterium]|nr:class I SAM-dependent methyltransferase [Acidobacteriota bacterium]
MTLRDQFGDIDIYLFDQLLRGRIQPGIRVLDAGCGRGRNVVYLLRIGCDVHAVDHDPAAVAAVRVLAASLAPQLPESNFLVEAVEEMSVPDASMDVVVSSAVLHFARDDRHFDAMVHRMWRALAPGGLLFCRLAASTGIEGRVTALGHGRFLLPDGSERYLVSEPRLVALTRDLGAQLVDPIKSTIVQDMRCMATWVVRAPR